MEYYTKSEGLGFLIRKSRIDFRIEFRGVSILFEFNSLIWLVSHDHHQTVRYGEVAGVSIAESTFFNSSGHKWPHDGATENLALRPGDVSTVKLCSKDEFVKWAKGGSDLPQVAEENSTDPVFYRHENSAYKSQSTNGPMWPSMTNLKVLQRPCESCWTALLNCYGQSLVPTSNGATWPRVVSTMIWQMFETNISSNLHISILDLDFSLVGPRPLYSFLGYEESRISGSC